MEVSSKPAGLETITKYMEEKGHTEYAVMMESSGHSIQVHRFFQDRGVLTLTAHAKNLRMITDSDRKTDKIDATHIARYLRLHLNGELPLAISNIPTREEHALRALCRLREEVTNQKSDEARRIHAHIAASHGGSVGNLTTKKAKDALRSAYPSDIVLADRLDVYERMADRGKELDKAIEEAGKNDDNVRLLMTIPGMGMRSAVQIMSAIIDVTRFVDVENMCSYFGLVPRVRNSGESIRHGHMTKCGDPMIRAVLERVTFVHVCVCDSSVTQFYNRKKNENKKKALISASRKMLCVIYAILSRRTGFAA